MKTKILLFASFVALSFFLSCTSNEKSQQDTTPISSTDVASTQTVDNAIDDVSVIADDQYEATEGSINGRTTSDSYYSLLPTCATKSDLGSTATVRVLTITFGNPNSPTCLFRGHHLKGNIILTRTIGTTFPKIMTVTFNNFYIDDNKLEGKSTWKREMVGDGIALHPKTTFTMTDMTFTTTGGVYTRNGERIREMIAGFLTRNSPTDDVFSTYGTFTTTHPNGSVFTTSIDIKTPLIHKNVCSLSTPSIPFPVKGILTLTKNTHTATIDFGTGECDNLAMLSIDGGVATQITLGN